MIPLSTPNISGNEWKYIKDCLDTGWVSSVGTYVNRFEQSVADFTGSPFAVATSSGSSALHICLLLSGIRPGDLVIVPDISFVAPVNAIRYVGADPVLIDVDPGTWQMDLDILEEFLKDQSSIRGHSCYHKDSHKRIAAILPVHVLGNLCDMDRLMELADRYFLTLIEDSTEALGSQWKETHAGTFGLFGCCSFNGNKIITTGGGGMILTSKQSLAKRAKHLTTQAKASTEEYYHDEVGYNYRLVNLLAAMGVAQMEQLPGFLRRKTEIFSTYDAVFEKIPGVKLQQVLDPVSPNHWLYTIYAPEQESLRIFLKGKQIECRPLWVPMHQLPAFRESLFISRDHQSDALYRHCLSLPCSTHLSEDQQQQVIGAINTFYHV